MSELDMVAALNEIDERKAQMPKVCPAWCIGDHIQAIEEGCEVDAAAAHKSGDIGQSLPELVNAFTHKVERPGSTGWRLELLCGYPGPPSTVVHLEVGLDNLEGRNYAYTSLHLTTGEARSMAAQLIALADRDDIGRWGA